jgi:transcription antitermination factor NusG
MNVISKLQERDLLLPIAPTRYWFAVYVWSNQEKTIDRHLRMKGIETFLPLQTVLRRWKNRVTAKVEIPLFTGYVFVKIARTQCAGVLEVSRVHSIVGNGRESLALPESEIEALRLGLQERQADPHPYLKVGVMARICSGPLTGMKGVVVRVNNQLRVVLSVDAIARSIAVHVTADELELCDPVPHG